MTALVALDGQQIGLAVDRWRAHVDDLEWAVLEPLPDPVLDIGCGPGRVAAALAAAGRPCLGIDTSPVAITEARSRGVSALERSVFAVLPGEGRWGAAVLLDGNIGIGGNPVRLLRRIRRLLQRGGRLLAELEPPGRGDDRLAVRIEPPGARPGPWFPWARVAADSFPRLAWDAGFDAEPPQNIGARWFGRATAT